MFKSTCFFIITMIFSFLPKLFFAQDVPTTLKEMFGVDDVIMLNEEKNTEYSGGIWSQGTSMPFSRFYGGSVMYVRNDTTWLYVFGGDTTGSGNATSTCLRYNVNTDTWEYIAPLPEPLRTNTAALLGDKLYTMGGFNAPFPAPGVKSFYEYDINTNTWTQLPDLPMSLFFSGAFGYEDSLIYIMGGIEDVLAPAGDLWSFRVHLYNRDNQTFRNASDMPEATANFGYDVIDNSIFLTGGLKSTTELFNLTFKGEINLDDRSRITWTPKTNYPLSVHAHYGYKISPSVIYYGGGSLDVGFNPINNAFGYDVNTNEYKPETDLPYNAMAFYGGVNLQNIKNSALDVVTVVIAGGITTGPALTNQTWVFRDTSKTTGITEIDNSIPNSYSLKQNYPNPFNPSTTIPFSLPKESFTKLIIYNSLGEKVAGLVSENLSAGSYKYTWNAGNLPSGIYFYQLTTEKFNQTKKLILIK